MREFYEALLTFGTIALVIFLIEYFSKAKDYERKIQKIAVESYDYLLSVVRDNPDWRCYPTNKTWEDGDFKLDLGINLETKERQFLIMKYLRKTPEGGGLRKGAKQLYRELIG